MKLGVVPPIVHARRQVRGRIELSEALAVARQQGALYYELLAAMDLVKLQERTEHEAAAVAELRRTYDGFTEGFQFPVLISARRLLAAHGIFTAGG